MSFDLSLYGVGHLSADNINDGERSSQYIASNSSRLGFRGGHSLDPTLSIIYQFETGLDPTAQGTNDGNGDANSDGQIFTKGRPSYIGLKGKFGQVQLGHMPALDQWANDYNLFADQVGDLGNLWEASGIPGRIDNVVYYKSPQIAGFDIALTYSPDEDTEDSASFISKGSYASGSLKLGLAVASIGKGVALKSQTSHAITVGYDFSPFSVGGGYQAETNVEGVDGIDRHSMSVGASVYLGKHGKLKAQYAISNTDDTESDAVLMAIGYDYTLNKETTVYVALASMDNDDNVNFSVNGKGHGDKIVPNPGETMSALSFGFVYSFDAALIKN